MIEENLGAALRQYRARQHLSLRTLADRTGFSPSFLSQLENGQSSPSLSSIEKITAALGVTLGHFFQGLQGPNSETGRGSLCQDDWHALWPDAQIEAVGAPAEGVSLSACIVTLEAGSATGNPVHPPLFDEFAYVLEGYVTLTMNTEHRKLRIGEGVLLPAGQARSWENINQGRARVLVVSETGGTER
jgi:XRE family transcriptional regulator, regulator of sulfur utilization